MKLYRAIEFSRLTFLVNKYHQNLWDYLITKNSQEYVEFYNWWLRDDFQNEKDQMIKNVLNNSEDFVFKSLDYNSKIGGRFNPAKSFGCLYCSINPTLSVLEVLYHQFESSAKIFKTLSKASDKITTSFNVPIPKNIEVLIIAFELDINIPDNKIFELCKSEDKFTEFCRRIGFGRYIDENFDANFIFGNDYEVTNVIGCHIHTLNSSIIKVPSARVEYNYQKLKELNNIIIPEIVLSELDYSMTGKFREYYCNMDLVPKDEGYHISLNIVGEDETDWDIILQPWPNKTNNQIVSFTQISDKYDKVNKKKYSRDVHLQRYII